jgi:hypothetical protein
MFPPDTIHFRGIILHPNPPPGVAILNNPTGQPWTLVGASIMTNDPACNGVAPAINQLIADATIIYRQQVGDNSFFQTLDNFSTAISHTEGCGSAGFKTEVELWYVQRDLTQLSTTTMSVQILNPTSTLAISGGFTYGEIILSIFAFLIFAVLLYSVFYNWLVGIKFKK